MKACVSVPAVANSRRSVPAAGEESHCHLVSRVDGFYSNQRPGNRRPFSGPCDSSVEVRDCFYDLFFKKTSTPFLASS